jgi:hypothetical protein
MANSVNYLSQIQTGQTIQAVHVNQFVEALSGSKAYDLVTSGSYTIIGPLYATASWATNALNSNLASSASLEYIASNPSTNNEYNLLFKNSTTALNGYHQLAADGTNGPFYNPSTNTLTVPVISGSSARITSITGSLSGSVVGNASTSTSASYALTSSVASATSAINGASYPSGSAYISSAALKMVVGSGKSGNPTPEYAVNITEISGKTLGINCFVTATVSGSGASSVVIKSLAATTLTFETQTPDTDFHYHIIYY